MQTHTSNFFNYVSSVCEHEPVSAVTHRTQKRASDPLELQLERVVRYLVRVLGTELSSSWEQYALFEPSLQSLATHTKFIDNLREPCSYIFIAYLWLNSQKYVRNWYCLKLDLLQLTLQPMTSKVPCDKQREKDLHLLSKHWGKVTAFSLFKWLHLLSSF